MPVYYVGISVLLITVPFAARHHCKSDVRISDPAILKEVSSGHDQFVALVHQIYDKSGLEASNLRLPWTSPVATQQLALVRFRMDNDIQ